MAKGDECAHDLYLSEDIWLSKKSAEVTLRCGKCGKNFKGEVEETE
jgi:transcription elongation factor Elf1